MTIRFGQKSLTKRTEHKVNNDLQNFTYRKMIYIREVRFCVFMVHFLLNLSYKKEHNTK
jgi:hypothetical protein